MKATVLFVIAGAILIIMALARSILARLPVSTAMLYLGVGVALGPLGVDYFELEAIEDSKVLMHIAEIAVLISLFASGLKLDFDRGDVRWATPLRLAFIGMVVTVALVAVVGYYMLALPLGAAVLLGAVLAPTDPVLASDVQVSSTRDRDAVRFGLTGEAGMNDGTAFPFVMLGLGLLGVHELGAYGSRWIAVDVIWAVLVGFGVGALLGVLIGRLVLYLRSTHREAVGLDEFLALGLIALSYGVALALHAYGFLAVFAAGVALRRAARPEHRTEGAVDSMRASAYVDDQSVADVATRPETAPAYLARAILDFNTQLEHIGELIVVGIVGVLFSSVLVEADRVGPPIAWPILLFVPVLFLVIRPLAVSIALLGTSHLQAQRRLISWFGIRGVGSVYYLMFAIDFGAAGELGESLTLIVLTVIAASIVVHGVSVTPLMSRYARESNRSSRKAVKDV